MTVARRRLKIKRWARTTAVATAAILLASAHQAIAQPVGWHGLGWDLPPLQAAQSVTGRVVTALAGDAPASTPSAPTPAVNWPAPDRAQMDLPATAKGSKAPALLVAGKLPVSVTRGHGRDTRTGRYTADASTVPDGHGAGRVEVATVDRQVTERAGIPGTLLELKAISGDTSGPVEVALDYRGFAAAYGADFGERLHFEQLPACVLTTPDKPECRAGQPVDSENDAGAHRLTGEATFAAESVTVLAATADTASGGGDFKATKLSPAGSWASGTSSGDFSYTYPISAPKAPNGKSPSFELKYSSGTVDGLTSATNNQASEIGDGWNSTAGGYIERSYKACAGDLGGNNGQTKTGDLCWGSDNATLSLGGSTTELIKDTATGTWHPRGDNGARVEKLTGAANGAKDGEHWKVTTLDGTQYFFGLNHLPGWQTGNPETQSTWTVPVFGNNAGEPCNGATFASSWCQQAWRWNLDYVVDPHGNATTYYYQPETNRYGLNLNLTSAGTPYIREGQLLRIEYGFNTHVVGLYTHAPAQIVFDTAERCLPNGAVTCDPGQLAGNAAAWPDVPADQMCAEGATCRNVAPVFFTQRRVIGISTQVTDGGTGWKTATQWSLVQSFPASGDGSSPAMWLDSITQTGKAGGSASMPPTVFHPKALANRVDANSKYTALTRNRIDAVTTDQGGVIAVKYADPQCVPGVTMPANPESNTLACYPVYWTPGGATDPVLDWFNKYVVTDVTEDGRTTFSQQALTHYDYLGGAAWHYDENHLGDPKYRTWSQWRGYATVKTTKGQATSDPAGPPTVSQALYLRGMDGDTLPGGGKRSVSVTDSLGGTIPDSTALGGFQRESLTYLDGNVIANTVNDPWISPATATNADGTQAFRTGTGTSRTRTWIASANKWRTTRMITSFDAYGLPTQVENDGDISDPAQATCTRNTYAQNTAAWLMSYTSQVQKTAGPCSTPASSGTIVSDSRSYFDHQAFGVAPGTGDITRTDTLDSWPAGGSEKFVAPATTAEFDVYGRPTASTDPLGLTTNIAYTPATGGPLTQVVTTAPPVSGTNSTRFTTVQYLDPITGAMTAQVDQSGLRTDATYDALGRLTALWPPGHDKSTNAPAATTYSYTVSTTGPSVVTANRLLSSGKYASTYELVDGLGRTVQTQAPTSYAEGGRVVTDSFYDSQGRTWKTHDAYWNKDAAPGTSLLVVQDNAVPSTTVSRFDSAGRAVASIYELYGTEQWRTTTTYDGDRTTTVPPAGGIASSVVTDGLGQKTQLVQYKDRAHTNPGDPADVTTYGYNHTGMLTSTTDSTGRNTWTTTYDLRGRKFATTDPDTGITTYTYDADNRMLTSTDASGRTLAYTYDNLGRKTAEYQGSVTGTKLVSWTYDTVLKGKLASSSRYADGRTYTNTVVTYDSAGRVTSSRFTIPLTETGLGGTYSFSWRYDPLSDVLRSYGSPAKGGLSDESMLTGYDALDKPATLLAAGTSAGTELVSETDYNPYGQILRNNYQDPDDPHQISITHTYEDGTNRLASTLAERATASDYMIGNRAYTYDAAGDITKIADTPLGAPSDNQCFGYDYLQRLTEAWTPASGDCAAAASAATLGGAAPYWKSWSFDQTGNRLTETQHATSGDTAAVSTYPQPGQPQPHAVQSVDTTGPSGSARTSYTYDAAGRTATQSGPAAQLTYTYDAEGRVATAKDAAGKVTSYVYDADGNRLLTKDATGTTLVLNDLEIFVAAGTSTAVGTRFYTFGSLPVAERKSGQLKWLLTDNVNTTYASVDAADLSVTKRWQDPYGVLRGAAPTSWPDKHGYLGGYQDTTGMVHLGARDYDPATGRFTTVDPVLDTAVPQQLNGYAYGLGNPLTRPDPSGLEPLADPSCMNVECRNTGYGATANWPKNGYPVPNKWPAPGLSPTELMDTSVPKMSIPTPLSILSAMPPNYLTSSDPAPKEKGFLARLVDEVWEVSGLADVERCIDNPSVVGCLKGAINVGIWFIPGGGVVKGAEAAYAGGRAVESYIAGERAESTLAQDLARSCNSFAGDTPVLMADGSTKPIAALKLGDEITNAEPDDSNTQKHVVTAIHITDDDRDFATLTIAAPDGPKDIVTTAHHLFWDTTTHAWTEAAALKPAEQLDTPGDGHAAVLAVRVYTGTLRTYNLTIDTVHTYYVVAGSAPVLVHNSGGPCKEVVMGGFVSFEQARNKALDLLGEIDPATRQPYIGRLESAPSTYGKVVGFTTRVNGEFKRLRLDYDPVKGPHINVEIGKGDSASKYAVAWNGTEEDFARVLDGNW
ncbi:RHS repeat-associated core domain-containing protein [Amycolatopsis tucumanensis]|uniref:RHS repeat-associated core domain-containing protein n=1 Tax=Amycolatopsis tucumanensis TaxID=401106 RepID=A0ABP7IFQ8_9PSEU|nr:RHS repeat-associated core domain-containing protein [Amycolatopsis tucumanensis]MCF6423973.1 type IV secretion protein Rhs [Amycolatopsis tucumanensis]